MLSAAVMTVAFFGMMVVAIAFAVATVLTRRVFRSAIYLMGTLTTSAAVYILLGAEFLAGVQILVYVGGIVVLIVFAVMLTSSGEVVEDRPSALRKFLGFTAAAAFCTMTIAMAFLTEFKTATGDKSAQMGDTAAIGRKLLDRGADGYVLPFEIISLLLLSVVIAAIVIARKTVAGAAGGSPTGTGAGEQR